MSASDDDRPDPGAQRQVSKNRFRALFIGTFLLLIVVAFGYMLLVSALA